MLKNGLPIRWTWVGESWQMPVKNCTFSTESAHTSISTIHGKYSNNNQTNYILSASLALSLSACLCLFLILFHFLVLLIFCHFPPPSLSFQVSFVFRFRIVIHTLPILWIHSIAISVYVSHLLLFYIWPIHIAWEQTAFSIGKKLSISTTQFEALVRAQLSKKKWEEASRTKNIIKIVEAK